MGVPDHEACSGGVALADGVRSERIKANGRVEVALLVPSAGVVLERPRANGRVTAALGVGKERLRANGRVACAGGV